MDQEIKILVDSDIFSNESIVSQGEKGVKREYDLESNSEDDSIPEEHLTMSPPAIMIL